VQQLSDTCKSSWLFVSIAFERILILDFAPTATAPDNAKSIGFCEDIYPSLKTIDIGGGLGTRGFGISIAMLKFKVLFENPFHLSS
jgi:hypothetical protein